MLGINDDALALGTDEISTDVLDGIGMRLPRFGGEPCHLVGSIGNVGTGRLLEEIELRRGSRQS